MSKGEMIIGGMVLPALSFGFLLYSLYVILRKGLVKDNKEDPGKYRDYYEERGKSIRRFIYGLFS
jgi:hypothetical protein